MSAVGKLLNLFAAWEGHLSAVGKLLNLFAATGHVNYAKSARCFKLCVRFQEHIVIFETFAEGYRVVRMTKRFLGGMWTDLVIEQVMIKSAKSGGGLTRERYMLESVRHNWIYSVHNALPSTGCREFD